MCAFTRIGAFLAVVALLSCGKAAERSLDPIEVHLPDTAAVRITPAGIGKWLVVLETLQPQSLVTTPIRSAALLGEGSEVLRTYQAPEGWTLIDAVAHPSGDVSLLSVQLEQGGADYPLRATVSRISSDGARIDRELSRLPPPGGTEDPPAFIASLDRARLLAQGEDLYALVRWANNSVQAYRLETRALEQKWATFIEPPATLLFTGIIGGGFDNFHQGDSPFFVHGDVDSQGNPYVAVVSTEELLTAHDAFFGENLTSLADPANFDFGAAVLTRVGSDGRRTFARLLGMPGRNKRVLTLRVVGESAVLAGRVKTGNQPESWDAWILSARAATGDLAYERNIDVQSGDMFWDVSPLSGGRLLAVGSTNYTQNPSGLSVSDARDPLAVVLDTLGNVEKRIVLPVGPAGRGNEAMSVRVGDRDQVAISGVHNAPGTHAPVFSDAFLVVRSLELL
jgi:hypothetical protein